MATKRSYIIADPENPALQTTIDVEAASEKYNLLCDPLTGLIAYPSFQEYVKLLFPTVAHRPLFLAIGDVDDLRGYVTAENKSNDGSFGHIAGNRCMASVGSTVRCWELKHRNSFDDLICGTFGGDEVIICATGGCRQTFSELIKRLRDLLLDSAPRPCSFVWAELPPHLVHALPLDDAYMRFLCTIDRSLFSFKAQARQDGELINAAILVCETSFSDCIDQGT
jgi:GGDEF domain-containing protein